MSRTRAKMPIGKVIAILSREKSVFLEGLSPAEVKTVVAKAGVRRYAANTVITNEATDADHLFLLLEGAARGYVLTPQGERIGLGWFPAGNIIGWAALMTEHVDYIVSMEAAASTSVLVWDRATIHSFAVMFPRLLENAMALAYHYVTVYRDLHLASVCDSAPQRLARVLGHLAREMGHKRDHGFELSISNEELANAAHVTIFTVSRQMQEWQRQGLVSKTRGRVVVHQPDELLRVQA